MGMSMQIYRLLFDKYALKLWIRLILEISGNSFELGSHVTHFCLNRHTGRQRGRHTDTQIDIHRHTLSDTDWQTDRQTDRQTDKQM